ncbi:unnamed protein product [Haemonchus placei]|uniref:RRM domain-containing protein n=1 Tax=Haemonchus placei TaxID=6290 RepID=A0A158QLP7_HAEPC|nr:unnamed protein product [Haemonchus placei]
MSVNNPSDSGGGGGPDVAFANPPSMTDMDMGTMGAWAEIMAGEQVQTAPAIDKNDENEIREQTIGDADESTRKVPEQQVFAVQVTNLPQCTNEELFYHFGGDTKVRDVTFLKDRCAARIDLCTAEALKSAKEFDGQQFRGRTLRVYEIREERIRERPSQQELQNRQYNNEPPSYSRDSRYNSQSSLYSNDARSYDRSGRSYNNPNDYRGNSQYRGPPMSGTFPRGGKFYNTYDDFSMGRYPPSGGQSYRGNGPYYHNAPYGGGGYPPRSRGMQNRSGGYGGGRGNYYGSQELQRSDSYHHDEREKPGPISRSRTESTAFDPDRRRMELSRTSSRLSTSTEDMDAPTPRTAPKKLTNKDIFGEAKPVDTSERLREIEAKQERERLLEQQKYKVTEEAEAARLAAAAEHPEGAAPYHQHQYGSQHGHVARDGVHHAQHHQYHHAPSRPPIPPHASYGPYQTSHNAGQHPQQPHANAAQFHPQQRYDSGGPGSYRIMRRESTDATDASPPLDPIHAKVPLQTQNIKETDRVQDVSNEVCYSIIQSVSGFELCRFVVILLNKVFLPMLNVVVVVKRASAKISCFSPRSMYCQFFELQFSIFLSLFLSFAFFHFARSPHFAWDRRIVGFMTHPPLLF